MSHTTYQLLVLGQEILVYWIPSHIRIKWIEKAYSTAKSALDMAPDKVQIPYIDLEPEINKFFLYKMEWML